MKRNIVELTILNNDGWVAPFCDPSAPGEIAGAIAFDHITGPFGLYNIDCRDLEELLVFGTKVGYNKAKYEGYRHSLVGKRDNHSIVKMDPKYIKSVNGVPLYIAVEQLIAARKPIPAITAVQALREKFAEKTKQ